MTLSARQPQQKKITDNDIGVTHHKNYNAQKCENIG